MGKRKTSHKVQKRPQLKLDKVFNCPFCNHSRTVEVLFERAKGKATISCRMCTANYVTLTNGTRYTVLTEAIDVYSEWIDECAKINAVG